MRIIRLEANKFSLNGSIFIYTKEARDALIAWGNELKETTKVQGKNRLVSPQLEYCCLGILGSLCIKDFEKKDNNYQFLIPAAIRICLHQNTNLQEFQDYFAYLNDDRLFDFKQISNVVFTIVNSLDNYVSEVYILEENEYAD